MDQPFFFGLESVNFCYVSIQNPSVCLFYKFASESIEGYCKVMHQNFQWSKFTKLYWKFPVFSVEAYPQIPQDAHASVADRSQKSVEPRIDSK